MAEVELNTTLKTIGGLFDPLVYLVALMFALLVSWYIWHRLGYSGYRKKTEQTKPFLCGHDEISKEAMHVMAGSIYWGFFASLKGYFDWLKKEHTGMPEDYTAWFVLSAGIIGLVLLAWGV